MQDTPAPNSGFPVRVYKPLVCPDCGAVFTPDNPSQRYCTACRTPRERAPRGKPEDQWEICSVPGCGARLRTSNTTGRCSPHRYVPAERDVCAVDGCDQPLRKDNSTGWCKAHKNATDRVPVRICAADGCDNHLRADNESGYCGPHGWQTATTRASRDRFYAQLRAESAERYQQRPFCSVDGCDNRLRSDNTSGRCAEHIFIPMDWAVCSVDGCETRVHPDNSLGRCVEHRGLYWADDAPKCGEPGCGKTLHRDNTTGFCHKHRKAYRDASNRDYYQRNQVALREYARQYREVYADEHREASLRWERANPERKRANDAAFRGRNRVRLRESGKAASRQSYARHAEQRRAESRDYRMRYPERVKAAVARWRAAHPEYSSVLNARRRLRMQLSPEDRQISHAYRQAIRHDPCFYCGGPADHTDHYFPLVKGGTDHWWNLVRACEHCNCSKQAVCGTKFLLLSGG